MHYQFLAGCQLDCSLQDNASTHRNAAKDIIWFAHSYQIIAPVIRWSKHDIGMVKRFMRLGDDFPADMR